MGSPLEDGRMEGWLYLIRSGRFGLQFSRKRYFVLDGNTLDCFKSEPTSKKEEPGRSALIDSSIRVTDNGRESIHRNILYIFTLYNSSNHRDQLKLGARSSEEAARWIRSLVDSTVKVSLSCKENNAACSEQKWQPYRFSNKRVRSLAHSIDWTVYSSVNSHPSSSDVIAPSPWTIFGCKNGLRLFKEAKDADFHGKPWDDHPAIMAVGVVDASSEAVFQTIMSLGPSRSEWDFCFARGNVVEHLDGHTEIIYKQLKGDWLPWGMKRRDLLLQRYWRREDDGTYVILYHSAFHKSCPPQRGFIRAHLKSGGYVISPVNQGKQSVVKHMLAIDWRFWKSYLFFSSSKYVTIRMLGRIAALRELFRAKLGTCSLPESSSGGLTSLNGIHHEEATVQPIGQSIGSEGSLAELYNSKAKGAKESGSFLQLSDATDEFFDVPDDLEYDRFESRRSSDSWFSAHQDQRHTKLSTAAVFVKKLHDLAVQKRGYVDLQEAAMNDSLSTPCLYGATLPRDPTCSLLCSWSTADPSTFLIRGETYLQDQRKISANGTLMQMVAADWLKSDKREDDLAGRPNSIVQKYAENGGNEFFFIVNIQVPGSTTYSLALYYMMDASIDTVPLLQNFVRGDDAYRNSRFKLIPYISKGSWIVKQSVGKKACLVGQALVINYFHGRNYLELGVDIGSSTIARGVVSLVLGYLNNLVIEMAFLIQANNENELPEFLLGTCRLNHLDAAKSISVRPW